MKARMTTKKELIQAYGDSASSGTRDVPESLEFRELFRDFERLNIETAPTGHDVRYGRRRYAPGWVWRLRADSLAWFLIVQGRKSQTT